MFYRVLADSSVWIDHFKQFNSRFDRLLQAELIVMHAHVRGELLMGSLKQRSNVSRLLGNLPQAKLATHDEVYAFVETEHLYSRGIGFTDAHILASARLGPDIRLWSLDKRLSAIAERLNLAVPAA